MKRLPKPWMLDLVDLGFALNAAGKRFEIRSANGELWVDVCLAGVIHLSTPLATISIGIQDAFPKEQMRLLLAGLGISPIAA